MTQMETPPVEDLDVVAQPYELKEETYDPRIWEDTTRRRIAYSLILFLASIFGAGVFVIIQYPDRFDNLMKLYQLIFTPIVALAGSAIGFYFGVKSKKK